MAGAAAFDRDQKAQCRAERQNAIRKRRHRDGMLSVTQLQRYHKPVAAENARLSNASDAAMYPIMLNAVSVSLVYERGEETTRGR